MWPRLEKGGRHGTDMRRHRKKEEGLWSAWSAILWRGFLIVAILLANFEVKLNFNVIVEIKVRLISKLIAVMAIPF